MLRYDVVDVFTDRPFAGNQLAVVHDGDDLDDAQRLALAREFGYSETTFPSRVSSSGYSVRILTPGGEIPFAGHPTLGTAWVLRAAGLLTEDVVAQACGAGEIEVTFGAELVSLRATPRDLALCPPVLARAVLADLGLAPEELAGTAYFAGTGLTFLHLPVADAAVTRAVPSVRAVESYEEVAGLGLRDPIGGINLVARDGSSVHARVFVPGLSVPEDPATGSAAAGLGVALVAAGVYADGQQFQISQGSEMGRPSTLHVSVRADAGRCTSVSVAGGVQPVASGQIAVPSP